MAELIYSAIASLDGYVADERGEFGWARPDEELHAFVNDLERPIGTYLYGRRMYEVMQYWEAQDPSGDDIHGDYTRIWQAADKIVYSRTLAGASTKRTRIEKEFDAGQIHALKASAPTDLSIGGPTLASHALSAGLVDQCHLFLHPVVVGGGNAVFHTSELTQLELMAERRFASGAIYLHYSVQA